MRRRFKALPQLCTGGQVRPYNAIFIERAYFMQLRNLQIPAGAVFCTDGGADRCGVPPFDGGPRRGLDVSEMASAKALTFGDCKSLELLRDKHPTACMPPSFSAQSRKHWKRRYSLSGKRASRFDMLDINMGCRRPRSPAAARAVSCCSTHRSAGRWLPPPAAPWARYPLTVKMRIGWDAEHLTGVEVAKAVRGQRRGPDRRTWPHAGADVYPTYRHGGDRGHQAGSPIPVLANGDVTTANGALTLLKETGCDGVMIGRGAGRPMAV